MYPYFQQHLQTREAGTEDPLRDFLTENPSYGKLLFQVSSGQGAIPIANATVVLTKQLADGHTFSLTARTDASGKTKELSLPAPSRERSQSPGKAAVSASYEAVITAPDHIAVAIHEIPLFDGITTIQPVDLVPSWHSLQETEAITDTPPEL